jgi:hypothetical protein
MASGLISTTMATSLFIGFDLDPGSGAMPDQVHPVIMRQLLREGQPCEKSEAAADQHAKPELWIFVKKHGRFTIRTEDPGRFFGFRFAPKDAVPVGAIVFKLNSDT